MSHKKLAYLLLFSLFAVIAIPALEEAFGAVTITVNHIQSIGIRGSDEPVKSPRDVAVDSTGKIHALDTGNNRVLLYDNSGKLIKTYGSPGLTNG